MKIAVITAREKSDRTGSVMQEAAALLRARGASVDQIYPEELLIDVANTRVEHDLYILKSGTDAALMLAGLLDLAGANTLNPYPKVAKMKDKILATKILEAADVPLPDTYVTARQEDLAKLLGAGPLVVKPYRGGSQGRGVQIVENEGELNRLPEGQGLIFAQRYHKPDGRDHKIYCIGDQVFGVMRVWPARTLEDKLGEPFTVSDEMREITLRCGRAFGVDLFGLDIIVSEGRSYVVDINTFPGFKGVAGAAHLLADYIYEAGERGATVSPQLATDR